MRTRSPHCVRDDNLPTDGCVVLKDSSPWQVVCTLVTSPLSLRAVLNARRGNLLTSSTLAARFLSLRWNVVTEAISSQATLVFGLLRYARNDKSQDRRTAFAMTIRTTLVMRTTKMVTRHKASRHDNSHCVCDDNLHGVCLNTREGSGKWLCAFFRERWFSKRILKIVDKASWSEGETSPFVINGFICGEIARFRRILGGLLRCFAWANLLWRCGGVVWQRELPWAFRSRKRLGAFRLVWLP